MSLLMAAAPTIVTLPTNTLPPIALGFMGLGTGYLIYGPQELFGYPKRSKSVDEATGVWGMWLPGFFQFVTGIILFLGVSLLGNFSGLPGAAYMAALAFTAYGIHWFVIGWNRARGNDPRANLGMAIGFLLISILGMIVFYGASDWAVGGLFTGLTFVYISDIFATIKADLPASYGMLAEKSLGFFHLGTGLWLMYLMFSATLHFTLGSGLPL